MALAQAPQALKRSFATQTCVQLIVMDVERPEYQGSDDVPPNLGHQCPKVGLR
jgi:hypothetical protein